MAITLPTGWQAILEEVSGPFQFVTVYELELDAGTEYYSDQAVTWNSQPYTRLAVRHSPIQHSMDPSRSPICTVTFDNINRTLQSNLANELIANRYMRIRLLLYPLDDAKSLTLLYGVMQPPTRTNELTCDIQVLGPIHGNQAPYPGSRRFGRNCEWAFADGGTYSGSGRCPYVKTTDASNSGSSSTALTVDDGTNLVDGGTIIIGSGDPVVISSGGGTTSITLAEARTWSATDDVSYANCSREYFDCQKREQTHSYGGFRGRDDKSSLASAYLSALVEHRLIFSPFRWLFRPDLTNTIQSALFPGGFPDAESVEERDKVVPAVYGRRLVEGKIADVGGVNYASSPTVARFFAVHVLSMGEIDSIVDVYVDESRHINVVDTLMETGYYYRAGAAGVDALESEADYVLDPSTTLRDQERDFYSTVRDTYSHSAYATWINKLGEISGEDQSVPSFDLKGIKVQLYTSGGSPVGGKVWSRNPIWQALNIILDEDGLGKQLTTANVDFGVTEPAADYCDVTVYGNYVDVVATTDEAVGGTYDVWEIDDTSQFTRGMTVDIDKNGTPVESEVVNIWTGKKVRLTEDDSSPPSPSRVRPKTPRFTSDINFQVSDSAINAIRSILSSCSGYVTYDEDGKIALEVEQASTATFHFKDIGATQGYSILSMDWPRVADSASGGSSINRVVGNFTTQELESRESVASDWDHRTTNVVRSKSLSLDAVDNYGQAYRLAKLRLDKSRVHDPGAEIIVGPAGLQVSPGDTIQVTHAGASWTDKQVRVIKREVFGLGDSKELMVKLTVTGYDASIYNDDPPPRIVDNISAEQQPSISLAVGIIGGTIKLVWVLSGSDTAEIQKYRVWKSTSTMSGDPWANGEMVAFTNHNTHYVYQPTEEELTQLLYFVVTSKVGWFQAHHQIVSNEVSVQVEESSPSDAEFEQGVNTVYDGDFNYAGTWEGSSAPGTNDVTPVELDNTPFADYTNPTQAYDSNTGTAATSEGTNVRMYLGLPGTTQDIEGQWEITHQQTYSGRPIPLPAQTFSYSIDSGSNWIAFTTSPQNGVTTLSPTIIGDRDDARSKGIRLQADCKNQTGAQASFFEAVWKELSSSTSFGSVFGGQASIRGDGASTYGWVRREWPGISGDLSATLASGDRFVTQLWLQGLDSTPTDDVEVVLFNLDDDTWTTIMVISSSDILSNQFRSYAAEYTAPATVTGNYMVGVRTLSSNIVNADKLSITYGGSILAFAPHINEYQADPSYGFGTADGYPGGGWVYQGGNDYSDTKFSEVSS